MGSQWRKMASPKLCLSNWNNGLEGMNLLKKMVIFTAILILSPIFPAVISAQMGQTDNVAAKKFDFSLDHCLFKLKNNDVLLELYYSIFRNYLTYIPRDSVLKASFIFKAEIYREDSLNTVNQWKSVDLIDSTTKIKPGQKLYGVGYFSLQPGEYTIKSVLTDINSKYNSQHELNLSIKPFSSNKLEISDIQLASQIKRSSVKNRYYKNGYQVVPNSDRFYGTGLPMLMFYSEIYNLKQKLEPDTTKYAVNLKLINGDGQIVRSFPEKIRAKPGNSAVEVSGMNIISFHSGTYFLEINVKDLFSGATISRRKKFFIFRQGDISLTDSSRQIQMKEKYAAAYRKIYSEMSHEQIDEEFASANYIATQEEKKIFKTLDQTGKQSFLIEFWNKRDKTPETPRNEFREDYLKLVNTANEKFGGFKKGWKTDRGRIMLVYGIPDEIERFPYSSENKPYVIWKYYSIQGGVNFIFVDKREFGNYELVHSTARGELYDVDWQRWINPN